jgi:hypothetical protein
VVSPELALTHEPAGLAAALARLAAADPDRYRSAGDGIELVYARAGIDPV